VVRNPDEENLTMSAKIIDLSDPTNKTVITASPDWRTAVSDLLNAWISGFRCFSSGEVAAALRIHRPDLRFSVPSVGEYIRDLFYAHTMPEYPDDGSGFGPLYPCMTPRVTVGLYPDRTPANTEVFVYGHTQADCDTHEFEVYIPKPGETMADAPVPASTPPAPTPGTPAARAHGVAIVGAKVAVSTIVAKVHDDKRLCVPRTAFELAVHLTGTAMRGGDPVFVRVSPTEAVISLTDPNDGSKQYDLSMTRGRALFPSSDPAVQFVPNDAYTVKVDPGRLTVDLTVKSN
jgi:hypothetical protein